MAGPFATPSPSQANPASQRCRRARRPLARPLVKPSLPKLTPVTTQPQVGDSHLSILCSLAIVGWLASTTKDVTFVEQCLQMALWRRDHTDRPVPVGMIHHSDRPNSAAR